MRWTYWRCRPGGLVFKSVKPKDTSTVAVQDQSTVKLQVEGSVWTVKLWLGTSCLLIKHCPLNQGAVISNGKRMKHLLSKDPNFAKPQPSNSAKSLMKTLCWWKCFIVCVAVAELGFKSCVQMCAKAARGSCFWTIHIAQCSQDFTGKEHVTCLFHLVNLSVVRTS